MSALLQQVTIVVLGALLGVAMALWSRRRVNPLWPALVFAVGHAAISFFTGVTIATVLGAFVAALVLGAAFFWALQRTQGMWVWWPILVVGIVLSSV